MVGNQGLLAGFGELSCIEMVCDIFQSSGILYVDTTLPNGQFECQYSMLGILYMLILDYHGVKHPEMTQPFLII